MLSSSFLEMQLGAGAFFIGVNTDDVTPETTAREFESKLEHARKVGDSLGATIGGAIFKAVPEVGQIGVDDMRYPVLGSTVFNRWEVTLETTIKEVTRENFGRVLSATAQDRSSGALVISGALRPGHYIPRLGWAGLRGDCGLIYIELSNALNIIGMTMTISNMGQAAIPVAFRGHQLDPSSEFAPCKIFFFDRV